VGLSKTVAVRNAYPYLRNRWPGRFRDVHSDL